MKLFHILLFCQLTASWIQAQNDVSWQTIEDDLRELMETTKAPGFSVSVIRGEEIIYSKGFGYRDIEKGLLVDAQTFFPIGSITKSFTSSLLGQLQEEGAISLEDSPRKYIPDLKFYNDEMNSKILIEDLMSHRTGLPRHDLSWYFSPTIPRDSLLLRIQHLQPFAEVRQKWHYNNFMFMLQGSIVERVTGKSWEENIASRILKPIEMSETNVDFYSLESASNAATGYELNQRGTARKVEYYYSNAMSPAGSIISNVNEMSKWLMTWINNGEYKGKKVLPANYVREAISSHSIVSAGLPESNIPDAHFSNYGFGWFLSSYKGHYRVEHGGNVLGFSANAAFYPTDSLGIVVLCNQNISLLPVLVRNTIADHLLGVSKTEWVEEIAAYQEQMVALKKRDFENHSESASPTYPLSEYVGNYANLGYGEMEILMKSDSLYLNDPQGPLYLKHKQYNAFEAMKVTDLGLEPFPFWAININFSANDLGEISTMELNADASIEPIKFTKQPSSFSLEATDLHLYAGEYNLMGTPIELLIKSEKTLFLSIPGQPEYELVPTAEHSFRLKALDGYSLEFVTSGEKAIDEVKIIQPNGTFTAVRKEE